MEAEREELWCQRARDHYQRTLAMIAKRGPNEDRLEPHAHALDRGVTHGADHARLRGQNEFGVLDHDVTLPSSETFYNAMRVTVRRHWVRSRVHLRRKWGVSDTDFERDASAVLADLIALKQWAGAFEGA
jgi:hypothetical protein